MIYPPPDIILVLVALVVLLLFKPARGVVTWTVSAARGNINTLFKFISKLLQLGHLASILMPCAIRDLVKRFHLQITHIFGERGRLVFFITTLNNFVSVQ